MGSKGRHPVSLVLNRQFRVHGWDNARVLFNVPVAESWNINV